MAIATLSSRKAYPTSWGAYDQDVSMNPELYPNEPYYGPRTTQTFEYTPVPPTDPMEELYKQAFAQLNPPPPQPQGPTPFWADPRTYHGPPPQRIDQGQQIKQAQAMIAQAMQYQGIRGYQRDLESGKGAADAWAKWAPMMLASDMRSSAAMLKALTPTPPDPTPVWVPPNEATQQPGYMIGKNIRFAPESAQYRSDVDFDKNVRTINGRQFYHNARTGSLTPLVANKPDEYDVIDYRQAADDVAEANKVLMSGYAPPNVRSNATAVLNQARETLKGIRGKTTAQPPPQAPPAPVTTETAAAPAGSMPKAGDIMKGYRFKGGDPSKKENWEKVQ